MALVSLIAQITSCISNSFYNNENRQLWQQLYEVERDLSISNIVINHKLLRRVALACAMFLIINAFLLFITFVSLFYKVVYGNDKAIFLGDALFHSYRYGTLCFAICQYASTFSILREIFLKLRDTARRKFLSTKPSGPEDLLEIARYHQQCCDIARLARNVVSFQLLVELMEDFRLLVFASFFYAMSVTNEYYTYQNSAAYAGWVAFGILRVSLLIVISHKCVESVSLYLFILLVGNVAFNTILPIASNVSTTSIFLNVCLIHW